MLGRKIAAKKYCDGKIKELLELFKDELRNNVQTYLWYIEQLICNNHNSERLSNFIELDERRNYKEQNDFYNIYQGRQIKIDDIFVEPKFISYGLSHNDLSFNKDISPQDDFVSYTKKALEDSKILFIVGPYGSGKTFLSKMLLNEIYDGISLFIDANRISQINDIEASWKFPIIHLIGTYKKCYIFIDSFDDIFDNGNRFLSVLGRLIRQIENLYFIVNFRKPNGINIQDLCLNITTHIYTDVKVIELCYFGYEQMSQWIVRYNTQKELNKLPITIEQNDFDAANKNLKNSCHIPLILFMLFDNNSIKISDFSKRQKWYKLYEEFVERTILGKFELENRTNAFLEKRKAIKKYRSIIEDIAISILKNPLYNFEIKPINNDDYILDPNDISYSIDSNVVKSIITKRLKKTLEDESIILFLNCYFFDYCNNRWKFKDNNILFFLCARKYCSIILEQVDGYYAPKNVNDSSLMLSCVKKLHDELINFPLHPVVIEYIINEIEELCEEKKTNMLYFIQELLENDYIINIPNKHSFSINYENIRIDVLLAIIYIRFNKHSYKEKLNHYFKRISQYYSFVKIIDKDLASIIIRYFRYIPVYEAKFSRINFKGYNWNYSNLHNVSFIQCKLQDTPMKEVCFDDVDFNKCFFKDMDFIDCRRKVTYNLCHILDTQFHFSDDYYSEKKAIELYFTNCILDKVIINLGRDISIAKAPSITFENCEIRQLSIKDGSINLKIDTLSYRNQKIKLENVRIINHLEEYENEEQARVLLKKHLKDFNLIFNNIDCNYEKWFDSLFQMDNRSKISYIYKKKEKL